MQLIDLSLQINNEMAGVAITPAKTLDADGWNASTLELYSHSGTHVDAPIHFGVTDQTIHQMPLDAFQADCWMIDCTGIKASGLIEVSDLAPNVDVIQAGDGLVFKTNWSAKYGTTAYRNELPRISKELAEWIVEREIKLIGVEPPSVADVNNMEEVTQIHEILLGGGVTIVEGLTNLEAIKTKRFQLLALPLKIENGDGCPARAVAISI